MTKLWKLRPMIKLFRLKMWRSLLSVLDARLYRSLYRSVNLSIALRTYGLSVYAHASHVIFIIMTANAVYILFEFNSIHCTCNVLVRWQHPQIWTLLFCCHLHWTILCLWEHSYYPCINLRCIYQRDTNVVSRLI